jgi:Rrf2 family protein
VVNQQFNFAVHILTALAFSGGIMDSASLARSVNTNPVVVRRVLQALRRAGLVSTFAGKHGGARLARPVSRISLCDIYDAVEPRPPIEISQRKAWKHCPVSCRMQKIMSSVSRDAEEVLRSHLGRVKLITLLRTIKRG